jgi:hypothetical protein
MDERELLGIQKRIDALESKLAVLERHPTSGSYTYLATLYNNPGFRLLAVAALISIPIAAYAATISVPNTFVNGTVADADEMNANFEALVVESNDQDSRIGTLEADLLAEVQARIAGDTALQANQDAEAAARAAADDTLQNNIDAEVAARVDADNSLQTGISDLDLRVGTFDAGLEGDLDTRVDALEAP